MPIFIKKVIGTEFTCNEEGTEKDRDVVVEISVDDEYFNVDYDDKVISVKTSDLKEILSLKKEKPQ
jgi:hypothetical protein